MRNNKIFITLKYAQTLDGRIATFKGNSRWISSEESRIYAHKLRSSNDAVLIGVKTVIKDNPTLTTRLVKGKNPLRVIVDSCLTTPIDSRIIKDVSSNPVVIAITVKAPSKRIRQFEKKGVEIIVVKQDKNKRIDLRELISILSKKGIKRLLVEGGSKVITSFLKEKLPDRLIVIIAPIIMGKGIEAVGDLGINEVKSCIKIKLNKIEKLGEDLVCIGSFKK